jgi:hypothetical protein
MPLASSCLPTGTIGAIASAFSASVPAFHDLSSNAVLTPLNIRVNGQLVLRSTPGVINSEANVVSCSYTDAAGLFVEITGVLTGALKSLAAVVPRDLEPAFGGLRLLCRAGARPTHGSRA